MFHHETVTRCESAAQKSSEWSAFAFERGYMLCMLRAHLDADRQVAEKRRLDSMRDGAELKYRYVSDQHSVALRTLLRFHQVLDAQCHRLLVEAPKQLQNHGNQVTFLKKWRMASNR